MRSSTRESLYLILEPSGGVHREAGPQGEPSRCLSVAEGWAAWGPGMGDGSERGRAFGQWAEKPAWEP